MEEYWVRYKKLLQLDSERLQVSEDAVGGGKGSYSGKIIHVRRTEVSATKLLAALGLRGRIEIERSDRDVWDRQYPEQPFRGRKFPLYLLYQGDTPTHSWRGLRIEIAFKPREGASLPSFEPKDYVLDRLRIMPR